MKYLRRFNESVQSFKELEFNEDMMVQTSMVMNLIGNPYEENYNKLGSLIETVLDYQIYLKLFKRYIRYWTGDKLFGNYKDLFILFVTTVIDDKLMREMFNNIIIHEGADLEEEFVSALEINGRVVLLLHSPDRGSSIRIQDDNYTIKFEEVLDIVESLCQIYNKKLK